MYSNMNEFLKLCLVYQYFQNFLILYYIDGASCKHEYAQPLAGIFLIIT